MTTDLQKTYYVHAYVGETGGRATLALTPTRKFATAGAPPTTEVATLTPQAFMATAAWCNPNDRFRFCKAKGRKIATGRMNKNKKAILVGSFNGTLTRKILLDALSSLSDVMQGDERGAHWEGVPRWARNQTLHLETPNKEGATMNKYGVELDDSKVDDLQTKMASGDGKKRCACGNELDDGGACPSHGTEPLEKASAVSPCKDCDK
jgi:hypothetical protein